MKNESTLGIDIGGTNTDYGIIDRNGDIVIRGRLKSGNFSNADDFVRELHNDITKSIEGNINKDEICGIGIGGPDANYYKGTIENPMNLPWKGIIPIVSIMEKYFNIPTKLTNDANAAAMGEMKYGAAKGMNDFIMITLGTGLGSGIVIDGKIVYGNDGIAGELGSMIMDYDDNARSIGNSPKGCLEAYCSATGIVYTANELLLNSNEPSLLRDLDSISSEDIYNAAVNGDLFALKIFDYTGEILGKALANIILFSNPEAIILFGGLAKAGDFILNPTYASMEKYAVDSYKGKTKLILSTLRDSDAAILGAGALGWEARNNR